MNQSKTIPNQVRWPYRQTGRLVRAPIERWWRWEKTKSQTSWGVPKCSSHESRAEESTIQMYTCISASATAAVAILSSDPPTDRSTIGTHLWSGEAWSWNAFRSCLMLMMLCADEATLPPIGRSCSASAKPPRVCTVDKKLKFCVESILDSSMYLVWKWFLLDFLPILASIILTFCLFDYLSSLPHFLSSFDRIMPGISGFCPFRPLLYRLSVIPT